MSQRTQAGGFDGIALFDNYVSPDIWRMHAQNCTARDLVFSFQVNPGFDSIVFPQTDPDSATVPPAFAPGGGVYDWSRAPDRAAAESASRSRIVESFKTTVRSRRRRRWRTASQGSFSSTSTRSTNGTRDISSSRRGTAPATDVRARARTSQRRRGAAIVWTHLARADSGCRRSLASLFCRVHRSQRSRTCVTDAAS